MCPAQHVCNANNPSSYANEVAWLWRSYRLEMFDAVAHTSSSSSSSVPFDVQRQVVGTRKASIAEEARKRPWPGVLAVVPCQLVGPSELPVAAVPRTLVWFFACVEQQSTRHGVCSCMTQKWLNYLFWCITYNAFVKNENETMSSIDKYVSINKWIIRSYGSIDIVFIFFICISDS